jgi:hypothetical protein
MAQLVPRAGWRGPPADPRKHPVQSRRRRRWLGPTGLRSDAIHPAEPSLVGPGPGSSRNAAESICRCNQRRLAPSLRKRRGGPTCSAARRRQRRFEVRRRRIARFGPGRQVASKSQEHRNPAPGFGPEPEHPLARFCIQDGRSGRQARGSAGRSREHRTDYRRHGARTRCAERQACPQRGCLEPTDRASAGQRTKQIGSGPADRPAARAQALAAPCNDFASRGLDAQAALAA